MDDNKTLKGMAIEDLAAKIESKEDTLTGLLRDASIKQAVADEKMGKCDDLKREIAMLRFVLATVHAADNDGGAE